MKISDLISPEHQTQLIEELTSIVQNIAINSSGQVPVVEKDFYTTKELKDRGWSDAQINAFVNEGSLTRIEIGGKAGFKYPVIQINNLLKKIYQDNGDVRTTRNKGKGN